MYDLQKIPSLTFNKITENMRQLNSKQQYCSNEDIPSH